MRSSTPRILFVVWACIGMFAADLGQALAADASATVPVDLARSRMHLAATLARDGKYEEALELYQEIWSKHRDHLPAYRGVKTCLLELKRYDELEELLLEESQREPNSPAVLEELGTVAVRQGRRSEAYAHWGRILDVQERTRGSFTFVADLLVRNRMLDEALHVYSEADSVHPGMFTRQKASLHELRFEFEEATRDYLRFLEASPTALSYVEGRLLRIGEAEEGLDQVISRVEAWRMPASESPTRDPRRRTNDVVLRKLLGDLYLEAGEHDSARQHYFRLVDDSPNQFSALLVFGKRCQTDGEYEVAIRVFERIVSETGGDAASNERRVPSALTEIAFCQQELGRWEDALATFQRIEERYPETNHALSARFQRGKLLRDGMKNVEEAEAIFRDLLQLPTGPWGEADPQFEVAECALWGGALERARGIYAAIRARPFSPETKERALYEEARALFYSEQFPQADSLFKAVAMEHPQGLHVNDALEFSILINTNPDPIDVLAKYGDARRALRVRRPEEAVALLEELEEGEAQAAIRDEALLLLGEAQRDLGLTQEALATLLRAVSSAQVPDLAADARLLRARIFSEDLEDPGAAIAEYEELLVTYPETLAADRARDLSADLRRAIP